MKNLTKEPQWLRANVSGRPIGVDREAKVIRGYVVAQLGPFKTPGRGEFDVQSLTKIVELMNVWPAGIKSRFSHPTLSADGLGKTLGRSKLGTFEGDKVRADLHLDPSAFNTPNGDLGTYVMNLAESDPDLLSSSLVLMTDREWRLDAQGRKLKGEDGEDLPPLWRPTQLHASDIVDTGDAVDGLLGANLSIDGLPDEIVRMGCELLDQQFSGCTREVVEARAKAFLETYLHHRFGELPAEAELGADLYRRKMRLREMKEKICN